MNLTHRAGVVWCGCDQGELSCVTHGDEVCVVSWLMRANELLFLSCPLVPVQLVVVGVATQRPALAFRVIGVHPDGQIDQQTTGCGQHADALDDQPPAGRDVMPHARRASRPTPAAPPPLEPSRAGLEQRGLDMRCGPGQTIPAGIDVIQGDDRRTRPEPADLRRQRRLARSGATVDDHRGAFGGTQQVDDVADTELVALHENHVLPTYGKP
mgnify:CR=1 FL=1